MTDAAARPSTARAADLFVYGPLGFALTVADVVPDAIDSMVARGRAEVEQRTEDLSQRIRNVRSMGEAAIAFGLPVVRRKATARVKRLQDTVAWLRIPGNAPAPKPARRPQPAPIHTARPSANGNTNGDAPPSDDLAIPGYDALSASQVVERLVGLAHDELSAVRDYEAAHRNRRTILGKIDQLTA
jgi:hypothetical protein